MKHSWKYFLPLIIISIIISLLQWNAGFTSLQILAFHMVFHALFFIGLWIESVGTFFAKKDRGIFLAVAILGAVTFFQVRELLHGDSHHDGENTVWILGVTILLLIIQNTILHIMNRTTETCSVLCHVTKFHITGDIVVVGFFLIGSQLLSEELVHVLDGWLGIVILLGMWGILVRHILGHKHH